MLYRVLVIRSLSLRSPVGKYAFYTKQAKWKRSKNTFLSLYTRSLPSA